ncbi:MAG: lytic murein transglycosylase [Candidatus Moranbacteria bacterium]|nr:lytic murein transglycosylase [Candidatus Moranbacteria bacterium]
MNVFLRERQVRIKIKNISKQNNFLPTALRAAILIFLFSMSIVAGCAKASEEKRMISENSKNKFDNLKELAHTDISDIKRGFNGAPYELSNRLEIEEAVDFASSLTGVRKEFLMGMLSMESNFGKNTGKCTYQEVEDGAEKSYKKGLLSRRAWNTFQNRREIIKDIAGDLGYDYRKIKVSCNPSRYNGTGGAMGIPQFMPDTWMEYKDRISEAVGKKNPDPWNAKDGVVAMALKLSDVPGVKSHDRWSERNAAKLYLSGTTSWKYDWYANQVVYWSEIKKSVS